MKILKTISLAILVLIVCVIATENKKPTGEYQVNLEIDHIVLMDNGRYVATIPYSQIGALENVFIIDNE